MGEQTADLKRLTVPALMLIPIFGFIFGAGGWVALQDGEITRLREDLKELRADVRSHAALPAHKGVLERIEGLHGSDRHLEVRIGRNSRAIETLVNVQPVERRRRVRATMGTKEPGGQ